jgi:hypothetical protein
MAQRGCVGRKCQYLAVGPKCRQHVADMSSTFPAKLYCIEYHLLMWVFSQCEQGISIGNSLVHLKASSLLPNTFGAKSIEAYYKAVERFMRKHD